ncbi:MAG TPA: sulfate ABC transporter substrate-binding protein [Candidatus Binatia bacterium]|jgi:sulfate transport system substrate-binding protein|nr:sulfate ABC transporter substrate-binding protein [Candidatus Binatia bacterium]
MTNRQQTKTTIAAALAAAAALVSGPARAAEPVRLLNVSYDPTRELWRDLNAQFVKAYREKTGVTVDVKQSHGGSSAQARAVVDGLEADVVTLALLPDTAAIEKAGLIEPGWQAKLPNGSVPYRSTIVFVVRTGNPKGIQDWPDLVKPGVQVITPSPKTSGNGKLSFLAAWGQVVTRGGSEPQAREYVTKLYEQVPVLDSGARGSTTTFAQKKIGDVHLTWENEAYLEVAEAGGGLEIVYPPTSILAEPPVAVVSANATRHHTEDAAQAYLEFLWTDAAQETIAKHHYRPVDAAVLARHAKELRDLKLFPVTAVAKDWDDAFEKFFGEGKVFDGIYAR